MMKHGIRAASASDGMAALAEAGTASLTAWRGVASSAIGAAWPVSLIPAEGTAARRHVLQIQQKLRINTSQLCQIVHVRGAKSKVTVEYIPLSEPARDRYTAEPTNYLQLLGALRKANSVATLKHLMQAYGGTFSAAHVTAALTRLPQLATYRPNDLVAGIPWTSKTSQPEQSPGPGARVARPGSRPRPVFLAGATPLAAKLMAMLVGPERIQVAEKEAASWTQTGGPAAVEAANQLRSWRLRAPTLTPRHSAREGRIPAAQLLQPSQVAACVGALGLLNTQGVHLDRNLTSEAVEEALGALARSSAGRADRDRWGALTAHGEPWDVARTIKGLAQLRHWPSNKELLPQLMQFTMQRAKQFKTRDVQVSLYGWVALGMASPALVDMLAARAVALRTNWHPRGIASVLHSLALATPESLAPESLASDASTGSTRSSTESSTDGSKAPQQVSNRHAAMEALVAGVAPQVVLMAPHDVAVLAGAVAQLGAAYLPQGDTQVTLPKWLNNLVNLLCDKAVRDLGRLQPVQLATVLDMATTLRCPHEGLLNAVVSGVLSERALDPTLSPKAAASVVLAITTLSPSVSPTKLEAAQAAVRAKAAAAGKKGSAGAARFIQPFRGSLGGEEMSAVAAELLDPLALAAPEGQRGSQYYQALLRSSAEWSTLADAACQRVLHLYSAPDALSNARPEDVIALCGALRARSQHAASNPQLVESVVMAAEQQLIPLVSREGAASHTSGYTRFDPLVARELLVALRTMGQPSAQLAATAAVHLTALLQASPEGEQTRQRAEAEASLQRLLPVAVDLLAECRAHGAEPEGAVRAAAQAYVGFLLGGSGSALPEHTASGLAPLSPRLRRRSTSSLRDLPAGLDGSQLGQLLGACQACGALGQAQLMVAASEGLMKLLALQAQQEAAGMAVAGRATRSRRDQLSAASPLPLSAALQCGVAFAAHAQESQATATQPAPPVLQAFEELLKSLPARLSGARCSETDKETARQLGGMLPRLARLPGHDRGKQPSAEVLPVVLSAQIVQEFLQALP